MMMRVRWKHLMQLVIAVVEAEESGVINPEGGDLIIAARGFLNSIEDGYKDLIPINVESVAVGELTAKLAKVDADVADSPVQVLHERATDLLDASE